jgi:hypothetical protein
VRGRLLTSLPLMSFRGDRFLSVCSVHRKAIPQSFLVTTESKSKDILVTGLGGLYGCEMLRIPHCLDNRLTVNCEILATCSCTYSPVCTSQEARSVSIK